MFQCVGTRPVLRSRSQLTLSAAPPSPASLELQRSPANLRSLPPRFDFDPKELKQKYLAERDKRLRPDGLDQYIMQAEVEDKSLVDDPWCEPLERKIRKEEVTVLILGGGFSGLLSAKKILDAGIEDFMILEKGSDFGGTWYWNRYPGAMCDTEAYIYMPLLEETGYVPVEKYTRAPEILQHCRRIGEKYDLYRRTLFQTCAADLAWDDAANRWVCTSDRGDVITAKYVVVGSGLGTSKIKLPKVPGLGSFKGKTIHTMRWDYEYTGGDSYGGLTKLADKKVAVVGTGCTGLQVVPNVANYAKHLYVVQRTPSAVDIRGNRKTDPEWAKGLKPGWQRERDENYAMFSAMTPQPVDMVDDGWTDLFTQLVSLVGAQMMLGLGKEYTPEELFELANFKKQDEIRKRTAEIVKNPETAEKLKAWYHALCKRPTFSDEYLETFNKENVTLLDTDGKGVERITEKGIVVNGEEIEIDCLIFATGFELGTNWVTRSGYHVKGRGGVTLEEKWKDGVSTLFGCATNGFPNMFLAGSVSQAVLNPNFTRLWVDDQTDFLAHAIKEAEARGADFVEVTKEGEDAWVEEVIAKTRMNTKFSSECTPGYYNNEGDLSKMKARNGMYGAGPIVYRQKIQEWKAKVDGVEFGKAK
ncbi:cyclododecanone monooxygenase [Hyaloraphidium curvatum]|nr:cyclododecanone monooxygenase [Hyaloraphidium curvatum]